MLAATHEILKPTVAGVCSGGGGRAAYWQPRVKRQNKPVIGFAMDGGWCEESAAHNKHKVDFQDFAVL